MVCPKGHARTRSFLPPSPLSQHAVSAVTWFTTARGGWTCAEKTIAVLERKLLSSIVLYAMTAIVLPTLVYSLSTKLTAYCTCLWQNKNRSLGISHTLPNSSQHNNSVAPTRPPLIHLTAAAVLRAPVGNAGTAAAPKIKRSELPLSHRLT